MNSESESRLQDLRDELKGLSRRAESFAGDARCALTQKTSELFDGVKSDLHRRLDESRPHPVQAALVALALAMLGQVESAATTGISRLAGRTRGAGSRMQHGLEDGIDRLLDRARDTGERLQSYASEKPLQATLIALGIAFIAARAAQAFAPDES